MHWENQGAFTSKVSVDMLKALGVTYVILGHSEPRTLFGESDANVNKKTVKALLDDCIACAVDDIVAGAGGPVRTARRPRRWRWRS